MSFAQSTDRLKRLENFGHSLASPAYVYRPTDTEQVSKLFRRARIQKFPVALRGAARSYGDAALNSGGVVLDLRRMNRILEWDPETGIVRVEPGVTVQQLWQHTLEDGWWPPVVPGTMHPTLGGCLAMNIHGKNNYQLGPIGEHVLSFSAFLPTGEELVCSPAENQDLFYGMIGGLGLLGVFTSISLQMKRVYSGDLRVLAWAPETLAEMIENIEARKTDSDYIVGWVDTTAGGRRLGRGQIHQAHNLKPGEDPHPARTLSIEHQTLPDTLFGIIPKSITWKLMRPVMNRLGLRAVNSAKYYASRTIGQNKRYRQSHAAFNFLLDYVPNWERAYGGGGMIQYQSFIPKAEAHDAFREMLARSQRQGLPSFLGVLKRHRKDRFLLSHAVDGYSLALDFQVRDGARGRLIQLAAEFDAVVLSAGGRFYFAKDSTLTPDTTARFLGAETLSRFQALKQRCDPHGILQTDLYRRCLRPAIEQSTGTRGPAEIDALRGNGDRLQLSG